MTFWSSPGQTFFVSLFSSQIRSELSLSHGEFGALYSAATLASAFVMIWTGTLVDRIDLRKFSIVVVTLLAIGCWGMSMSYIVPVLGVSIFLLRHAGQGLMFLCSSTAMVRYLEPVKGKASSISSMGYPLGEAIFPSIAIAMLLAFGWRTSWQFYGGFLLLVIVPLVFTVLSNHKSRHLSYLQKINAEQENVGREYRRRQWQRSEVIRDPKFYLILPGLLSQPLMFTGFIFHQVHLVESKGWDLTVWGSLFVVYALVSVAFNLICGGLIDRFGASRIVPFHPIPMAIGLLALSLSSAPHTALVFLVMTGITVGLASPLSTPFFAELYGNKHIGSIKSLSTSMMVLFSAISPVVIGWMFDLGVTLETLTLCGSIYIAVTSTLAYWTLRKYVYSKS